MINDDRFLNVPHLPQYGDLRARCSASLPTSLNVFMVLGGGFFYLLVMAVVTQVIEKMGVQDHRISGVAVLITSIVVFFALRFAMKKYGRSLGQQALFVYEGGIHLNEGVTYVVNYGRWIEFCSGMRQVSIPWRLIGKFKAREVKSRRNRAVEVSLRLPDGRKLSVSTIDGKESADAIETLIEKLG